MSKKDKLVIDKEQYKHYLIDTVEILTRTISDVTKENESLQQQLDDLTKYYNQLSHS